MSKAVKSAAALVLIIVFLVFAGVMMNKASKALEHWAYPIGYG